MGKIVRFFTLLFEKVFEFGFRVGHRDAVGKGLEHGGVVATIAGHDDFFRLDLQVFDEVFDGFGFAGLAGDDIQVPSAGPDDLVVGFT